MDEKVFDYLLKSIRATDTCLDSVNTALKALTKQARINRTQRAINVILGGLVVACVANITDLIRVTNAQNAKIAALEEKIDSEGTKKRKGE